MGWPIKKLTGINVDPAAIGSRLVGQNPAGQAATAPIQVHRHARNGKAPDAWLINQFCEAANQAILYRTKEIFASHGALGLLGVDLLGSAGAGDRVRWRWAFHTGVFSRALLVNMIMYPQNLGLSNNSKARIDIYTSATYGGSPVATATFNYGPNPGGGTTVVDGISYLKLSQQYIEGLSPDTDYYGVAYDVDNGRMVSCSISEINSMTERFDGYMPQNITAETPILDVYRENLTSITYDLWRRSGATLFNATPEDPTNFYAAIASSTPTNLLGSSTGAPYTTYGAAVPGILLDMTRKSRRSQLTVGVPIRFCAYVVAPAANTIVVSLRNSVGTALVNLTQAGAYTGWVTGTGVLPVGEDKMYITHHRSAGAGTVQTHHVSCYEYE